MKKSLLLILVLNFTIVSNWVNAEPSPKETSNALEYANQLTHELASCEGKLEFNTKTGKTDCVDKKNKEPNSSCEMSFAGCNGSYHVEEN